MFDPTSARASARAAALLTLLFLSDPVQADTPYTGWRGHFGTPYSAYKAGADFDSDRRPLDGSLRNPPPFLPGTWSGLYLGGHLGGGVNTIETAGIASAEIDADAFIGGIQAGYNLQIGNVVAGLEIDGTWADSGDTTTRQGAAELTAGNDWVSSARLRLGYATDRWMVYATGGVALGDIDLKLDAPGLSESFTETKVGYAVGGGIEYKLTDSWVARVEALHYSFAEETFDTGLGRLDVDSDVTTVRAGLSLRLN
ncbi:MAG: outer membrane protein [Hyphomicrobium sp.]